jgi:hypothetical protein
MLRLYRGPSFHHWAFSSRPLVVLLAAQLVFFIPYGAHPTQGVLLRVALSLFAWRLPKSVGPPRLKEATA